eukprot:scaffold35859_cov72-Cyclotella_meneghiniana.AAC.3
MIPYQVQKPESKIAELAGVHTIIICPLSTPQHTPDKKSKKWPTTDLIPTGRLTETSSRGRRTEPRDEWLRDGAGPLVTRHPWGLVFSRSRSPLTIPPPTNADESPWGMPLNF